MEIVRFVGWLERPRALALQRAADTLLVVTGSRWAAGSVATGKLFEYLAGARRPILVLGEETEAAASYRDGPGLDGRPTTRGDRRCAPAHGDPTRSARGGPMRLREYAYPELIQRLEAVIDRVAARRERRVPQTDRLR